MNLPSITTTTSSPTTTTTSSISTTTTVSSPYFSSSGTPSQPDQEQEDNTEKKLTRSILFSQFQATAPTTTRLSSSSMPPPLLTPQLSSTSSIPQKKDGLSRFLKILPLPKASSSRPYLQPISTSTTTTTSTTSATTLTTKPLPLSTIQIPHSETQPQPTPLCEEVKIVKLRLNNIDKIVHIVKVDTATLKLLEIAKQAIREAKKIFPFGAGNQPVVVRNTFGNIVHRTNVQASAKFFINQNEFPAKFAYDVFRSKVARSGTCRNYMYVVFDYLLKVISKEELKLISKEKLYKANTTKGVDHTFIIIKDNINGKEINIAVDPWPLRSQACLLEHHFSNNHIKIDEAFEKDKKQSKEKLLELDLRFGINKEHKSELLDTLVQKMEGDKLTHAISRVSKYNTAHNTIDGIYYLYCEDPSLIQEEEYLKFIGEEDALSDEISSTQNLPTLEQEEVLLKNYENYYRTVTPDSSDKSDKSNSSSNNDQNNK